MKNNMKKISALILLGFAALICSVVWALGSSVPDEKDLVVSERDRVNWNQFHEKFKKNGPAPLSDVEKKNTLKVLSIARKIPNNIFLIDALVVDEQGVPIPNAPYELKWIRHAPEIHWDASRDVIHPGVASDKGRVRLVFKQNQSSDITCIFKVNGYYNESLTYRSTVVSGQISHKFGCF